MRFIWKVCGEWVSAPTLRFYIDSRPFAHIWKDFCVVVVVMWDFVC